jgi:hypothetical protein
MPGSRRWIALAIMIGVAAVVAARPAQAGAEVKLGKDFLDGVVAKLPPTNFEKDDRYRGTVHSYRLTAIDPKTRRFLIACRIEGEFHPKVSGPITDRVARSPQTPEGWRKFGFDIKARVNIEPDTSGAPRFKIEIDEVKKRDLDGFTGIVAKLLGQYFDDLVTQIASGRASRLNNRLNDEVLKRVGLFKDYGVFQKIDYSATEVVLHFDTSRFQSEGVAGYVFPEPKSGVVPLYRWVHPRDGSHYYTIAPGAPDRPNSVSDGVACYLFDHPAPDTVPLYRFHNGRDQFYTTARNGEKAGRVGYRPAEIAGYLYPDPKPGTLPFYRFFDPVRHQHFYTLHPHAEFAK